MPLFESDPEWALFGDLEPHANPADVRMVRRAVAGAVTPGRFRMWRSGFEQREDPWRVFCLLAGDRPKVVRGYGGWGQTAREGRRAVSTFAGSETPAVSVTVRLDWRRPWRRPVVDSMRALERLSGWDDRADDDRPPRVKWIANVPRDYFEQPHTEWVVESLEWGDSYANDIGILVWQDATVVLGLYRGTEVRGLRAARAFPRRTLPKGRSLRWFARKYLGDASRWDDVAALNRDNPRCPQTPGHEVRRAVGLLVPPREPRRGRR